MQDEKNFLKPGQARVEYFACCEEIEALLIAGHTVKSIYEKLKKEGRITMTLAGFYKNCSTKGGRQAKRSLKTENNRSALQTSLFSQSQFSGGDADAKELKVKKINSSLPTDKILSLGSDLNQKLAASKDFIESYSQEGDDEVIDAERINRITGKD